MIPHLVAHHADHLEAAIHAHVPRGHSQKIAIAKLDALRDWVATAVTEPPRAGLFT